MFIVFLLTSFARRVQYIEFAGSDLDIDLDAGGDTITEFGDDDFTSSANGSSSAHLRLPNPNAEKANRQGGKPLESLLIGKNRKLEDGMTKLRVSRLHCFTSSAATHANVLVTIGLTRGAHDSAARYKV